MAECSATSSRTRARMASSCWPGVRPSSDWCWELTWSWRRRPDTRTWKNSSRLDAKMARNLTRSSSGLRVSRASWRTRALNSIQESSRLRIGPFWSRADLRRLRPAARGPGAGRTAVIDPLVGHPGGGARRVTPTAAPGPGRVHENTTGASSVPVNGRRGRRSTQARPARRTPTLAFRDVPPLAALRVDPDAHGNARGGVHEALLGRPEALVRVARLAPTRAVQVAVVLGAQ